MNSVKPVNVYVVLCTGSIDRRVESLVQEKSDAAEAYSPWFSTLSSDRLCYAPRTDLGLGYGT